MLQKTTRTTTLQKAARIAIVASVYNAEYVDSMIDAALETLAGSGVNDVELIRVPGAFEIPVVAAKLAQRKRYCGTSPRYGVLAGTECSESPSNDFPALVHTTLAANSEPEDDPVNPTPPFDPPVAGSAIQITTTV